jgi:hypothetical protein
MLLICTDSRRARAYLQSLNRDKTLISKILVLATEDDVARYQAQGAKAFNEATPDFFQLAGFQVKINFHESVYVTATKLSLETLQVTTTTINDPRVIHEIGKCNENIALYSGFTGEIVEQSVLSMFERLYHVHPGVLPTHKGSTVFYYTLLHNKEFEASVIIMDEGIDTGEVMGTYRFKNNGWNPEQIDHFIDPYLRAMCANEYFSTSKSVYHVKGETDENLFYVAHPLIRGLAKDKLCG